MKKSVRTISSMICIICLTFSITGNVYADFAEALPLPELTGDYKTDILAVAQSQLGYSESETGETVYSDWAGQSGRHWCSEFVAWCADAAGIPTTIIPAGTSTKKYRKFFSEQKRFYILDNEKDNDTCGCSAMAAQTISFEEILPGDILLVETDHDYSDGADHTCMAVSNEGDYILTIDGNSHDQVEYQKRKAKKIHGICRPLYGLMAVSANIEKTEENVIRISWDALPEVSGYQVYRAEEEAGDYKLMLILGAEEYAYQDEELPEEGSYYYKVRAYITYDHVTVYGGFTDILSVSQAAETSTTD